MDYIAKYNECEARVPDKARIEEIAQQTITNESLLKYELWALKNMGWELNGKYHTFFFNSETNFVHSHQCLKANIYN